MISFRPGEQRVVSVNALIFLIGSLARLYMLAFLLRLLLQVARADFYNPISQLVVQVTNPLVVPARRIIPSVRRFDFPTLVVLALLQLATTLIISALRGFRAPIGFLLWDVVFSLLWLTISTYLWCIVIYVILSWFPQARYHPITAFLGQLTAPVLRPARRLLPPMSGIDLSPLIVSIFLWAALILLSDLRRLIM
jgi:YggT family protein